MTGDRNGTRHVVHVIGSMRTGGAERALLGYLRAADRREFRHTLVCLDGRGEMAPLVEAAGVPVKVVRVRQRQLLAGVVVLARWLRRERVEVVHTHMYGAALYGRIAARLAGVPVLINTVHGPEVWKSARQIALERLLGRWTAYHFAVARDGLEIWQRRERVPADRIQLLPNGVLIPERPRDEAAARAARERFGLPADAPVLGTVGRLVPEKGYHHLVDALKLARREVPDLRWLVIGDGPLRATLEAQAEAAGLREAVTWAGLCGDVEALLPALDLWVMSSVEEGLPVALLEAMAAGCAIVATRIGGIPDAVEDGREAVLVPVADPAALAAAVTRLLGEPERARRLGDAARQRAVAEYSIDSVARRIEDVYRRELARARGGAAPGGQR